MLFLVATGRAQASQLQLTPLYLAKSNCERRLDRCLQGCRAGGLDSAMCVSLCYKERESCAAPQSDSSLLLLPFNIKIRISASYLAAVYLLTV